MNLTEKSINYLKSLSAETVSNAKSGHTGMAIGASSIIFALFKDHLIFDPKNPLFQIRDRFVLSAGHASAMLYSIMHLFGYDITIDDLKKFRTYGSKTPGHPEKNTELGIELTSGPLGQGIAHAVGLAIAETMHAARFNTLSTKIFNNYTYCMCGDGCLMEGVALEACSLAGTLNLNKLILLYDDNNNTIDGTRDIANNEDTIKKFNAMNWNTILVKNGNDYSSCTKAIEKAKHSKKPTLILFKTKIGLGTEKENSNKAHAYPMPEEDLKFFKSKLGIEGSFYVPEDVYEFCKTESRTEKAKLDFENAIQSLKTTNPDLFAEYTSFNKPNYIDYNKILNSLNELPETAGRDLSHFVLLEISKSIKSLVGGSADLAASTKAYIGNEPYFSSSNRLGRNIHFGIREHSMTAIANGISIYHNQPVFDSTFMTFSNYAIPSLRLRAMMKLHALSIYSHDSIDIGEDGPTHQPIEQLSQLRSIVGQTVYRPATTAEVVSAYKIFTENNIPMVLVVSKSKLKNIEGSTIELAEKGGYVIYETSSNPKLEIFATGKEVELAIEVAKQLNDIETRVISMPCISLFENQPEEYKNQVLLKKPTLKIAIEASNDNVWYKFIGETGLLINVTNYQTSAKGTEVYTKAGFDTKAIIEKIKQKI